MEALAYQSFVEAERALQAYCAGKPPSSSDVLSTMAGKFNDAVLHQARVRRLRDLVTQLGPLAAARRGQAPETAVACAVAEACSKQPFCTDIADDAVRFAMSVVTALRSGQPWSALPDDVSRTLAQQLLPVVFPAPASRGGPPSPVVVPQYQPQSSSQPQQSPTRSPPSDPSALLQQQFISQQQFMAQQQQQQQFLAQQQQQQQQHQQQMHLKPSLVPEHWGGGAVMSPRSIVAQQAIAGGPTVSPTTARKQQGSMTPRSQDFARQQMEVLFGGMIPPQSPQQQSMMSPRASTGSQNKTPAFTTLPSPKGPADPVPLLAPPPQSPRRFPPAVSSIQQQHHSPLVASTSLQSLGSVTQDQPSLVASSSNPSLPRAPLGTMNVVPPAGAPASAPLGFVPPTSVTTPAAQKSEICAACSAPITEEIIHAMGKSWHPQHFVCCQCARTFPDGIFFEHDGKPYCKQHHDTLGTAKCAGCGGLVTGTRRINALGKVWHPEHFLCSACNHVLPANNFAEQLGKAYCFSCLQKIFG